jgi:hypothetical protein
MMPTITGSNSAASEATQADLASPLWKTILTRVLQLSFLFFFLKGIAWLVVGFLAWKGLT